MATVNISITAQQNKIIDRFIKLYDFENRSEFFRTLIRFITLRPELVSQSTTSPFIEPADLSTSSVIKSFAKTKKYNPRFLKDLETGLKESKTFNWWTVCPWLPAKTST